jgi:translation elongation factor EF-G
VAEIEISAERDQVLPIVGDLAQRGGHELRRRLAPKGRVIIQAELPMRSFLSYDRDLGTLSGGRARLLGEPRLIRWAEVRQR